MPYSTKQGSTAREGRFNGEPSLDELIASLPQDCLLLATRLADEGTAGNLPSVPGPIHSFGDRRGHSGTFFSWDVTGTLEVGETTADNAQVAGIIDALLALVEAVQAGQAAGGRGELA